MDGNFVSEHLRMRNPADDVNLSDGHGFMVTAEPYQEHLRIANDSREVPLICLRWTLLSSSLGIQM